jgi:hypothetical protein
MSKKKSYADEPHVPANKIANKPLVQNASLGSDDPPLAPVPPAFGKPPIGGSHGYGHQPHQRVGHLRNSGNVKAHSFGKK